MTNEQFQTVKSWLRDALLALDDSRAQVWLNEGNQWLVFLICDSFRFQDWKVNWKLSNRCVSLCHFMGQQLLHA